MNAEVGSRIVCTLQKRNYGEFGFVRFIGSITGACGTFLGIEFDNPVGEHDGSRNSIQYFQCEQKHGLFLQPQYAKVVL